MDRAKGIAEVAQTVINSAKVEVEFIREVGVAGVAGNFFPGQTTPRLVGGGQS